MAYVQKSNGAGLPGNLVVRAWTGYLNKLSSDPLMTKSISAGVLSVVSDLVAKILSKEKVKTSSLFNELTMGLIIRGPINHWFHLLLDNVIFRKARNQFAPGIIIGKLVLDQFVFSPLFIALYFIVNGFMLDQRMQDIADKIITTLPKVMLKNWSVWIPANAISYALIPLNLRVLYGNIISIFWTAYLIKQVNRNSKNNSMKPKVNQTPSTTEKSE
mmetsp:Transcript_1675/g.2978  ORF Transcript_1675/g.2978 Transcript_1675/m.2978 type:complete len:216 (-) Transcript_1675:275-922(-)|eukprot:CAMPEP_0182447172 /NCGR_PEP_ID=MMETSP1172-20130603/12401_1 /TAXON_ID=708627 /ORGANISM="Timspurckia oligopyrenoides, Strain CCMP3278" /LENGTH=215 /DNA_ID=CAMNT_0024643513 /DNA_START=38 /DNA_END=685 /DNA_ORIENTATION=-